MVHFLDCPSEIRLDILSFLLPNEVRAVGPSSRRLAVLPLILSCQTLKSDVLRLFSRWSPTFRFDHYGDIAAVSSGAEASDMRKLSLRLFSGIDIKGEVLHGYGMWYDEARDMVPWASSVKDLPGVGVRTVVLDLTPAPMWMVAQRPDWVRSIVLDNRCSLFLRSQEEAVARLIERLCVRYGDEVAIQIGGQLSSRGSIRRLVRAITDRAQAEHRRRVEFAGEWLSGEKDNPLHLSLPHISCRWGIATEGRHTGDSTRERHFVARSRRRDGPAMPPDLGLEKLGPIAWSKDSTTSYYINARDNERDTRETLIRILAFALESKQGSVQTVLGFPTATMERRKLIHNLGRDLGLRSESVGEEGEKFVRISYIPPESLVQDGEEAHEIARGNIPGGTRGGSVVHAQITTETDSRCPSGPKEDSSFQGQGSDSAALPSMDMCLRSDAGIDEAKTFKNRKVSRALRLWLDKVGTEIQQIMPGRARKDTCP